MPGRSLPPTPATIKGPAYRRGAPFRSRLCPRDQPGEPLVVSGTVASCGDGSILPGALLDVWQTDSRGLYSNLLGLARRGNPRAFLLRGRVRAGKGGRYRFESVVPGHYPLWIFTRPRHIHFMVDSPGHRTLVTQLYFNGDPLLSRDRWVKEPLVVPLEPAGGDELGRAIQHARFDIVLEAEGP
jgi:catechol 1,2-dioxygenase